MVWCIMISGHAREAYCYLGFCAAILSAHFFLSIHQWRVLLSISWLMTSISANLCAINAPPKFSVGRRTKWRMILASFVRSYFCSIIFAIAQWNMLHIMTQLIPIKSRIKSMYLIRPSALSFRGEQLSWKSIISTYVPFLSLLLLWPLIWWVASVKIRWPWPRSAFAIVLSLSRSAT